jgi:aminoglycoside phosphotransferase (APT) family kinase protein
MTQVLGEAVLSWAAAAVEARIAAVEPLHDRGPWRLRIDRDGRTSELVLRIPVQRWINADMVATNAAALQLAEKHDLPAPRLLASDLDGRAAGVTTSLETVLPGSSAPPPTVSAQRLRGAGAAIAKAHAIALAPQPALPLRTRHTQVDDHAFERRWATLYQACPDDERPAVIDAFVEATTGHTPQSAREVVSGHRLTPLLHLADERVRAHEVPQGQTVLLHGDIWAGNMLWEEDTCTALIDWKTAGVGDPGVDLGNLRMQMALQYGPDAATLVLDGWQHETGRDATNVAYWDAVAALNTPAEMDGPQGFDNKGAAIGDAAVTNRRDTFLRAALDHLRT